jgi:hypothetical protein
MDTMSLNRRVFTHGLMKKIGMNESCIAYTVHNKTTKLTVVFVVVVTMMIFLVPMLTELAYARTYGYAYTFLGNRDPAFTNVKGHLDAGKWIKQPTVIWSGHAIEWVTAGSGIFGGDEKGSVLADFGPGRHVTFSWTNPDKGPNTCKIQWTGKLTAFPCEITQDSTAEAKYIVTANCINC